jgi:hypothetical protein
MFAFQIRLTRRVPVDTSRSLCDAQAVRIETPLRDTLQQQLSFDFGSATHDTLHRAVSHAAGKAGVVRKRIFNRSCPVPGNEPPIESAQQARDPIDLDCGSAVLLLVRHAAIYVSVVI